MTVIVLLLILILAVLLFGAPAIIQGGKAVGVMGLVICGVMAVAATLADFREALAFLFAMAVLGGVGWGWVWVSNRYAWPKWVAIGAICAMVTPCLALVAASALGIIK